MKNLNECDCPCHKEGAQMMHIVAYCTGKDSDLPTPEQLLEMVDTISSKIEVGSREWAEKLMWKGEKLTHSYFREGG